MAPGVLVHQRQPETRAGSGASLARRGAAGEAFKDQFALRGRDTWTAVLHGNPHGVTRPGDFHAGDAAAVLLGIAQQVVEDLCETSLVADHDCICCGGADGDLHLWAELAGTVLADTMLAGTVLADTMLYQFGDVDEPSFEDRPFGIGPGDLQEVLHQLLEPVYF